jgi:hypothetical protein
VRRDLAEEIVRRLLDCSAKLDQSVASIQGKVDNEFFVRYRALVGQTMGMLYLDILRPIFREYPELEPESMR